MRFIVAIEGTQVVVCGSVMDRELYIVDMEKELT